jgi:hypothetical protein
MILFLCFAASAIQGAKEDLAETVIRGVEHREQLIKRIRSMKAIWQNDELRPGPGGKPERVRVRELLLLEGEKQRVETVFTRVGEGERKRGAGGPRRLEGTAAGAGIGTIEVPSGTREVFVYDGRSGRAFTSTGDRPGSPPRWRAAPGAGRVSPSTGTWAGIGWRFEPDQARARANSTSSEMRRAPATVERLPGPPERYKLTVRLDAMRGTSVWWVAPQYGYAVTRREAHYDYPQHTRLTLRYEGFKELAPGVWLPHRSELRWYLLRANGKWELIDSFSAAAEVMKLNIDIPDDYLRVPEGK